MPEQSEGNNHTSKINVFPVLHTMFFLLAGQKVDFFASNGAIKSTLWPASRKSILYLFFVQVDGKQDYKQISQRCKYTYMKIITCF